MLDYPYENVNNLRISGCIVRDATFRGNSFASFRIAHNVSAKAGTLFYDCEMYVFGEKKLPVELLKKGSKVIIEGKFDSRRMTNYIKVENVVANEMQMTVLSNGEKKAALERANCVELNGEICNAPRFGKNNAVVRFLLRHELDQVNGVFLDCVMFASDTDGKLPTDLLREGNSVVVKGRLSLNTFRNPEGDKELIVESMRAAEKHNKPYGTVEKDTEEMRTVPAAEPVVSELDLFSEGAVAPPMPEIRVNSAPIIIERELF